MAMKPRRLFSHPNPSFTYMDGATSGKRAPNRDRLVVSAAIEEAANTGKLSMIYVWMGMNIPIMPKPKGTRLGISRPNRTRKR
jgi:hypothetical protein